jgi:hypothetical protein
MAGRPSTQRVSDSPSPPPGGAKPPDTDLVLTPGGWRPRTQVHRVEHGHHISGKGGRLRIIETATGTVVKDLGEASKQKRARPGGQPGSGDAPLPDYSWIENTGWSNTGATPIAYFSTTWVVPPAPASNDGQVVFLFNGLEQNGNGAAPQGPYILQPVLQWGLSYAGGGAYWSITNWYVGPPGSTALYKPLINVNPGDVLQGVMTLTGQSGTEFSYQSSFIGYPAADLTVTDIDELTWACETLECYGPNQTGLTQCSDYPDTALTAMYDIELKVGDSVATSTEATISWQAQTVYSDCGQSCLIVSNDSPQGAVYLYYRNVAQTLYFIVDKNTFGKDEVTDAIANAGGLFPNAFWLALEGFTIQQLTIDQPSMLTPTLAGPFDGINGISITPNGSGPIYELPGDLYTPQRILYPFDITFGSPALSAFPASGESAEPLTAAITVGSANPNAETVFELVAGADPYFTNVDPSQNNAYYLSQDLRVFTITPEANNAMPIGNVPFTFQTGSPTELDPAAAYTYIQNLIGYVTANFSDPSQTDPFDPASSVLPGQTSALTGDSSVTPATPNPANPAAPFMNYNFALARVRLRGTSGATGEATDVRVFFRVFTTQTVDTDYVNTAAFVSAGDPNITYPSSPPGAPSAPTSPLPGTDASGNINGCTLPFFAAADQSDLQPGGVNVQTIEIPSGSDSVWAYFGCFLDVYDPNYLIGGQPAQYWLAGGTHHCIVAQIADADAPIENTGGVIENPENSDKLAQRNLQITASGNPGFPATHRIPQTLDVRPSPVGTGGSVTRLSTYPDELMITWGATPPGSIGSIYWPQASAAKVIELADNLYGAHQLSAADSHTISFKNAAGAVYVPIPSGAKQSLAGLMTVELPSGVRQGQHYDVVVRRLTSRRPPRIVGAGRAPRNLAPAQTPIWRYVVGTFQMSIPVERDGEILPAEENLLAILKWRQGLIPATNRWSPVLQKYIGIVAARVQGLGGNPALIRPSQYGTANQPKLLPPHHAAHTEYVGKVLRLRFDRFGDFEGFTLITEAGHERSFWAHEPAVERLLREAWMERILIAVRVHRHDDQWPASIDLLRPPH